MVRRRRRLRLRRQLRRSYAARGSGGLAGFDIAIPRDGGLKELLADAAKRPARFDRVIVESISRLSRNSSVAFRVEDELRSAGVRLCAADEPLEESFGTIVLRHVNIGIARGYHNSQELHQTGAKVQVACSARSPNRASSRLVHSRWPAHLRMAPV
ncbi:MAG: recombinase family protein [Acidimicrobiales bacterium]